MFLMRKADNPEIGGKEQSGFRDVIDQYGMLF